MVCDVRFYEEGCDLRDCERWPKRIAPQLKIAAALRAVVLRIGS